jgi:hypothetical protein
MLHASVCCRTIKSDRVRTSGTKAVILTRYRGRQSHIEAVTAEPPDAARFDSPGIGEIDAVYHVAFEELDDAVHTVGTADQEWTRQSCAGRAAYTTSTSCLMYCSFGREPIVWTRREALGLVRAGHPTEFRPQ